MKTLQQKLKGRVQTGPLRTQTNHVTFPLRTYPGTRCPGPCDNLMPPLVLQEERVFVTRSMQSNDMQRLVVHVACLIAIRILTFALQLWNLQTIPSSLFGTIAGFFWIRKRRSTPCGPHFPGTFHSIDTVRKHAVSHPSRAKRPPKSASPINFGGGHHQPLGNASFPQRLGRTKPSII